MPQRKSHADRVAVIAGQLTCVSDERRPFLDDVVLDVPVACAFLRQESRSAFDEYLPLAVRLSADWVMARDEANGEHPAAVERHVVAAARREVYLRRFSPAANLNSIVWRALGVPRKRL